MRSSGLVRKLDHIEPRLLANSGKLESSVYGIVDKVVDGKENVIRKWKGTIGNMVPSDEEPTIYLAEKLEPVILKHKKYKCLFGGRAGTKSIAAMDIMVGEVNSNGTGVFCLREQMKSLSQSIYKGINGRINTLNFAGFTPVESKWKIDHRNGGIISFGGLRNVEDMKSLFEYKIFLLEESANTSQEAIDILGPTLRGVDNAELWYLWNPKSFNDPMSIEFINPYQDALDRGGYYEDDYYLIINISFEDNPWFEGDESLRIEYEKDQHKVKKKLMRKSRFNHIWNGGFNDGVDSSLIEEDWFEACVDAHIKLGFKAKGGKFVTHDPADVGTDTKTVGLRHGVVFTEMEEIEAPHANDAFDYACGFFKKNGADVFGWDCDGMGALLRNQAAENFKGTNAHTFMFKGSESVHYPEAICSATEMFGIQGSKLNKDVFRNKRAQNYTGIAERCRKTYDAVENGTYYNPDELISFSSTLECLSKLKAELCRLPFKPNSHGSIELYTKQEMKKGILMPDGSKLKLPSPGLADLVMMSFDPGGIINKMVNVRIPTPLRPIGQSNVRSRRT